LTLFAGIVARTPGASAIPEPLVAPWAGQLGGGGCDRLEIDAGPGFSVLWVDTGGYPGGARRGGAGSLSWLAGDPLLAGRAPVDGRALDFDRLHAVWAAGDESLLRTARGAFCGVHLDTTQRRLWLIADKLALRPLYYAELDEYVCFATSLRLLLRCPAIPRDGDLEGLVQTVTFGGALGGRTAIAAVRCVVPAQVVELRLEGRQTREYWRWDRIESVDADDDATCTDIRAAFGRAVRARLDPAGDVVSLLSGGLDSRCIVACLHEEGARVHTIGFGPPGTADHALARQVAEAFGTEHFAYSGDVPEFWSRLAAAHSSWLAATGMARSPAPSGPGAGQVWSGEGGDRVLAPVNLTEEVIAGMRAGDPDRAIAHYLALERCHFPRRLVRRRYRDRLADLPGAGLRSAFEQYDGAEGGRRFHLYVLLEEARRNLRPHFEDFDRHRIELVMPFYDSDFVATVLRYPLDRLVRHRLYNRLMSFMPAPAASVPWQAYPGSEPCPLPLPPGIRTQWETWHTPEQQQEIRRRTLATAATVTGADPFPGWLISRPVLRAAHVLLRIGVQRYSHLFGSALPFVSHPPRRDAMRAIP
jgi:asparagine synthetase B (glutamine-hydrolysing)